MIEISLAMSMKVVLFVAFCLCIAMFVLWPIGDKPTSKTQFAMYFALVAFTFAEMFFGIIKWVP